MELNRRSLSFSGVRFQKLEYHAILYDARVARCLAHNSSDTLRLRYKGTIRLVLSLNHIDPYNMKHASYTILTSMVISPTPAIRHSESSTVCTLSFLNIDLYILNIMGVRSHVFRCPEIYNPGHIKTRLDY
jgi:hypothetical protein